jgi:hypothetical protein
MRPAASAAPACRVPDVSQVIVEAGQMPFMITNAQKAKLRSIGYDDDAISKMTPEQAHRNLQMMN